MSTMFFLVEFEGIRGSYNIPQFYIVQTDQLVHPYENMHMGKLVHVKWAGGIRRAKVINMTDNYQNIVGQLMHLDEALMQKYVQKQVTMLPQLSTGFDKGTITLERRDNSTADSVYYEQCDDRASTSKAYKPIPSTSKAITLCEYENIYNAPVASGSNEPQSSVEAPPSSADVYQQAVVSVCGDLLKEVSNVKPAFILVAQILEGLKEKFDLIAALSVDKYKREMKQKHNKSTQTEKRKKLPLEISHKRSCYKMTEIKATTTDNEDGCSSSTVPLRKIRKSIPLIEDKDGPNETITIEDENECTSYPENAYKTPK